MHLRQKERILTNNCHKSNLFEIRLRKNNFVYLHKFFEYFVINAT